MTEAARHLFRGEVQLAGWRESHTSGAMVTLWLEDPADLDAFRKLPVRKGSIPGQRLAMSVNKIQAPVEGGEESKPAAVKADVQAEGGEPLKGGPLSRLAAALCSNPKFQLFVFKTFGEDVKTENECADFLRKTCGVSSRAELDHNENAARTFHERFRKPFLNFNEKN